MTALALILGIPVSIFISLFLIHLHLSSSSGRRGGTGEKGGRERVGWSSSADVSFHTIRLQPGDDLKRSLLSLVELHQLRAASVVTCVGSLRSLNIRLASASIDGDSEYLRKENEKFEIVSLVGTMELNFDEETRLTAAPYAHLHIAVADSAGNVVGGHLMDGCFIYTTAELTVMENHRLKHGRELCDQSGYEELAISTRE